MAATRTILLAGLFAAGVACREAQAAPEPVVVVVRAGTLARKETPVRLDIPLDRFGPAAEKALAGGPKAVSFREVRDGRPVGEPHVAQADMGTAADGVRVTFVLPGDTPAGAERRFQLDPATLAAAEGPWSLNEPERGRIFLENRNHPVFRYNTAPVSNKDYPALARDAYIHPAYTPSGALITGDFSRAHSHHRGFFFAYTKTDVGGHHPDFWNIQNGTGKVVFERLVSSAVGPVTARIEARHRWEAKGIGAVLRERWEVEAYDIPGTPYWLFDLTSTQVAVDRPMELPPYRYGGMAYRGPEPFLKGALDVLTSAGLDRKRGDQKPARWVDLTGPVADGSDRYGGAMILDHPSNVNHPTVARIHPTSLPFFAFTPSHDAPVTIRADRPTVFRYRVVIHDGRPDAVRNERLWRDFAEPPAASIEPPAVP